MSKTLPEAIIVFLYEDLKDTPRQCICSANEPSPRPANVRVLVIGEDHRGGELPEWSAAEWRCPDGASLIVDATRRQARLYGIPFKVEDSTGLFKAGELGS